MTQSASRKRPLWGIDISDYGFVCDFDSRIRYFLICFEFCASDFEFGGFRFVSDFVLRISDFPFRALFRISCFEFRIFRSGLCFGFRASNFGFVMMSAQQFLVGCLRAFLSSEETQVVETPADGEVDWNLLLDLASWHRVMPLLYRTVRSARPQIVPEQVLTRLEAHVRSALGHSLSLTGEMLRLLRQFGAHSIAAIPIKGPALAAFLYGDPALRQFVDIDLLLRPDDFPAARDLLLSLGYQPQFLMAKRGKKIYLQDRHHEAFALAKGDRAIALELHRSMMSDIFPFHPDLRGIWDRRQETSLAGATVSTLSPEDLLLFLCVHGSKHGWYRVQWLCDVARLVRIRADTMDWDLVMEQAATSGGQRMVFLGLSLTGDILGAPIPREIKQKIRDDALTAKLAAQVRSCLLDQPLAILSKRWRMATFHLQLLERPQDRVLCGLRYWARQLTIPTLAEWKCLPLPEPLFPLYYVFRPIRLAGKYVVSAANCIRSGS